MGAAHSGHALNTCRDKTRDRLKLIARVVNVEQWAKEGPLSSYEHGLLKRYNDKPILTRPQHTFFRGPNYMEVDLDIHTYAWVARQAFGSFIPRLGEYELPCSQSIPMGFSFPRLSLFDRPQNK